MYKRIVFLTFCLLILSTLSAEEYDIYSPLPSELPKPYEIYQPEYTYTETGINSDYRAVLLHSWINSRSNGRVHIDLNTDGSMTAESDLIYSGKVSQPITYDIMYNTRIFKGINSFSGSSAAFRLNHSNEKADAAFSLPVYLITMPSGNTARFDISFDVAFKGTSADIVLFSHWQDFSVFRNSNAGLGISKGNISAGIEYSRLVLPFIKYNTSGRNIMYSAELGIKRVFQYQFIPFYSSMSAMTDAYLLSDIYCFESSFNSKYFKATLLAFRTLDDTPDYRSFLNNDYSLTANGAYIFNSEHFLFSPSLSYHHSDVFRGISADCFAQLRFNEYLLAASGSMFYSDSLSYTADAYAGADNGSIRIIAGIKNIFSSYDPINSLYSPKRALFINLIFRTWNMF